MYSLQYLLKSEKKSPRISKFEIAHSTKYTALTQKNVHSTQYTLNNSHNTHDKSSSSNISIFHDV